MNAELFNVAQIIRWSKSTDENGVAHYEADLQDAKGYHYWVGNLSQDEWLMVLDAELRYEMDSAAVPNPTPIADRNPIKRTYSLCSWCRSEYDDKTGEITYKLTDAEYELTTHPESGVSHGICPTCKAKMLAQR